MFLQHHRAPFCYFTQFTYRATCSLGVPGHVFLPSCGLELPFPSLFIPNVFNLSPSLAVLPVWVLRGNPMGQFPAFPQAQWLWSFSLSCMDPLSRPGIRVSKTPSSFSAVLKRDSFFQGTPVGYSGSSCSHVYQQLLHCFFLSPMDNNTSMTCGLLGVCSTCASCDPGDIFSFSFTINVHGLLSLLSSFLP